MSLHLQIVFILASISTLVYIIHKIRRHKLSIDSSIIWMVWAIIILVLSVFPQIATFISKSLGFISTSNFIFSLFVFFLYIILFLQMITISNIKEKNKELVQKLSLMEYKKNKKENDKK